MTTVESYHDKLLRTDAKSLAAQYSYMVYPISSTVVDQVKKLLLPGKTVAMFSGSWRLSLDACYIEIKKYQHCELEFHPDTVFVDHQNIQLFDYALSKLQVTNLLILHNDWWTAHLPITDLLEQLDVFTKHVRPHDGQVICTLPLIHVNFNKLTTSVDMLVSMTGGIIVDDSIVFVRK